MKYKVILDWWLIEKLQFYCDLIDSRQYDKIINVYYFILTFALILGFTWHLSPVRG